MPIAAWLSRRRQARRAHHRQAELGEALDAGSPGGAGRIARHRRRRFSAGAGGLDDLHVAADHRCCDSSLRIRLWGVDAPERHEAQGPASTRALAELMRDQTLVCQRKGASYNRTVAQCWIGDRDVAAEMVRLGAAADDPRYSRGHYAN